MHTGSHTNTHAHAHNVEILARSPAGAPLALAHLTPASRRILKGADCSIEKITLSAAVPPSVTVRYV
jgi:hypothetical protein